MKTWFQLLVGSAVLLSSCAISPVRTDMGIQTGQASWYGPRFHGRLTASGEPFDQNALTAAHRYLPMGTMVDVISLTSGKKVTVRINDRGPYAKGRIIDLSYKAAQLLGMVQRGHDKVEIRWRKKPER